MSYRLIDSNAIAIKYPEVNEMPCVFANLPDGLNGQFIDAQSHLIPEIQNGIRATDANDVYSCGMRNGMRWCMSLIDGKEPLYENCPSAQLEERTEKHTETHACDLIDREAAVDAIYHHLPSVSRTRARTMLHEVPSAQLGQRYTNEELEIFQHGISLSLLSKRSAQHWRYDENTATEIKFLERLYEKVSANMRGGQNE